MPTALARGTGFAPRAQADGEGLRFRPLHPLFGTEVEGIDLAGDMPDEVTRRLRAALGAHLVLVFREQRLAPEAQLAFTTRLGRVMRHPLPALTLRGVPEIVVEAPGRDDRDQLWHMDLAWTETPNGISALAAGELEPGTWVTEFASQVAAYERLGPWLKHRIEFLEVEHRHRRGAAAGLAGAVHPLVRLDPGTGRRALLLDSASARQIRGLSREESDDLLHRLQAAATHPAITLRHHWRPGDVVLWDNMGVQHRTSFSERGRLHRTMVSAPPPIGPRQVAMPWVSAG